MSQLRAQTGPPVDLVLASQRLGETVSPLNDYDLEILFNCFCRHPAFFAEARRLVQEHHFDSGAEFQYQLLWRALLKATDSYGTPNTEILTGEILRQLRQLDGMLPDTMVDAILRQDGHGLVWSAMNTEATAVTLLYGRDILQRFLHERTVVYPLRRFMNHGLNGSYAADLGDFVEAVQRQQSTIRGLAVTPRAVVAPEFGSPLKPQPTYEPTGVDWMDRAIGGQMPGEANGIIGVISAGKTTCAVHMSVASARYAAHEALRFGKRPRLTVLFTAEEPEERILPRVRSTAFQIKRDKLDPLVWERLSTQANLEHYDRALVAPMHVPGAPPAEILSEMDRWQLNRGWLQDSFELLDVSGSSTFPHAGEGFVPELVGYLESVLRDHHDPGLRTVCIDWAGILCRRHMGAANVSEDKLRHYLTSFVTACRVQIAQRFNCVVWIFHQIKADELTASPTKLFHHGHAAESKAFATELAVCGCLGVPDKATGCRRLNFSKVRRNIPENELQPLTVKIHPLFSELENVSNRYGVDGSGQRFALLEDIARVHGAEAAAQRQGTPGPPGLHQPVHVATDPNEDDVVGSFRP